MVGRSPEGPTPGLSFRNATLVGWRCLPRGALSATEYEVQLRRGSDAPRHARDLLSERFGAQLAIRELDKARLLTSELVTNALLHGEGTISLRTDLDANRLRVEVVDEGSRFERLAAERELDQIGGWGLRLVESESSRWGIREGTTRVWFELNRVGITRLRAVVGGRRRSR